MGWLKYSSRFGSSLSLHSETVHLTAFTVRANTVILGTKIKNEKQNLSANLYLKFEFEVICTEMMLSNKGDFLSIRNDIYEEMHPSIFQ